MAAKTGADKAMAIKSNKEVHSIGWLKEAEDAGKLNKSISIQRKEVWDAEKKSNLIVSLLLDIPVESLLFEETEAGYNVLDGKQRTLSICAYLGDAFALSPAIRVKALGEETLTEKRFSELSPALQKKILNYELQISTLRPLGAEERALVFFMRNQAVALTKMDLSRVLLGEDAMNRISALCQKPFFTEKIKLTEPARRKNEDMQLILQYVLLSGGEQNGLSGKALMSLCDDIKNDEVKLDDYEITSVLDYLDGAVKQKAQYLKKVQVPVVMWTAKQAMEKGLGAEEFGEKLNAFFVQLDPEGAYLAACKSGSAKKANVQLRMDALKEAILG